ncbi:VOC family protein [Carnobacteriaceae bacterium 52-44]|jgi:PhnB protein
MLIDSYPYFIFDGNAAEAIVFYKTILNAKNIDITYFRDLPEDPDFIIPDEAKDLVMNASFELPNGGLFMFSDNFPGMPFSIGEQISTTLIFDNEEETRHVFKQLSEDGNILMELQETFWSPLYGNVIDRYGNQWQVSTELKNQ